MAEDNQNAAPEGHDEDRRDFLKTAGKLGIVIPPAMAFLMTTSLSSTAIAVSGGKIKPPPVSPAGP